MNIWDSLLWPSYFETALQINHGNEVSLEMRSDIGAEHLQAVAVEGFALKPTEDLKY